MKRIGHKPVGNLAKVMFLIAALLGSVGFGFAQTLTVMPQNANADPMVGTDTVVRIEIQTPTNFVVEYDLGPGQPWAGAMVHWGWQSTDLSGYTQFVFGVKGDPNQVAVKFETLSGASQVFEFPSVTDTFQFWTINASDITVDLSTMKVFVFETSDTRAGAGNWVGEFSIYMNAGFTPPPPEPVDVSASDPSVAPITILPGEPLLNDLDATVYAQHSTSNFTVSYNVPEVGNWAGVMVRWEDFAPQDLTAITQFVFGVMGDPASIKVDFEDNAGGKTTYHLNGIGGALQHWLINASEIANLDNIKVITFVVDHDLAGVGNYEGEYTVFVGGLGYEVPPTEVNPTPAAESVLTVLPDYPLLNDLDATPFTQHSASNFTVFYDLPAEESWVGVMVRWEDWGGRDLSAITQFVFGVTGTAQSVKVEFEDANTNKTAFILTGVTGSMNHWLIPASQITESDLSNIVVISFVVDRALAGVGNTNGQYTVYVDGLGYEVPPTEVNPTPAAESVLTVLPDNPLLNDLNATPFTQHSASNFTVFYDLPAEESWVGVMVRWEDWGGRNLSAITQFVFGVTGTAQSVTVAFEDANTNKTAFILTGVTGSMNHWRIPASLIDNTDLSNVRVISFVVDRALAGDGNTNGQYTVYVDGLAFISPPPSLEPMDPGIAGITILPDNPLVNDLEGTAYSQHSSSNFTVFYNIPGEDDWDGIMVRWEDWGGRDLTAITQFVFGVTGTPQAIKVEFEDTGNNKTTFYLAGVGGSMNHWHIPASLITGSDLSAISVISFVVDRGLAGEGNVSGHFTVFVGGLGDPPPPSIGPVSPFVAPITVLPDNPLVNDLGGTLYTLHSTSNFTVSYDLPAEDSWSGVMVRWDDWGGRDLSAITQFVFGVTGTPQAIKVEFEDFNTNKTVVYLTDVGGGMDHWHIPASLLTGSDMTDIKVISFVVDRSLAGDGNTNGHFTVFVGGLEYTPASIIPLEWYNEYALPSDGSVDNVDMDGDSFTVMQEYIAGTNPRNDESFWHIRTSGEDQGNSYPVIRWNAVAGRRYRILRSVNLLEHPAGWVELHPSVVTDSTGEYVYTDTTAANDLNVYRVIVEMND